MALTATASQGYELYRHVGEHEVLWVPGDPSDSITRGDALTFSPGAAGGGVADIATDNEAVYGIAQTTKTITATTTGFPKFGDQIDVGWGDLASAARDTLIGMIPVVPKGTPVWRVTLENHQDDENITSWTAGTLTLVVGTAAQDDANNGLMYVYGGAGVGQWNVIADVNGTNGLIMHRTFATALDATSDIIWLAGEAADNTGVGFFGRTGNEDGDNVEVNDHADNGTWTVYMDAREVPGMLSKLMLPVIPSALLLLA